ncbi:hypothetical protein DWG18_02290 [Lysobacter sp. TY2-98]|nr:hypothetical protein DWG18_02290 [Lysobacter sp. TY2-98]
MKPGLVATAIEVDLRLLAEARLRAKPVGGHNRSCFRAVHAQHLYVTDAGLKGVDMLQQPDTSHEA